jgi:lysine 6-dehydrogenase
VARTTGFTCTIVARQLLAGNIPLKGICPLEYLGKIEGLFQKMLAEYQKRGISLKESIPTK